MVKFNVLAHLCTSERKSKPSIPIPATTAIRAGLRTTQPGSRLKGKCYLAQRSFPCALGYSLIKGIVLIQTTFSHWVNKRCAGRFHFTSLGTSHFELLGGLVI